MNGVPWFALSGRVGRRSFWLMGVLVPFVVGFVLALLSKPLEQWASGAEPVPAGLLAIGLIVIWLLMTVIGIGLSVRRMHDLGRSGWWVLLNLVPLVNIGMFIWQGFYKGMSGPNEYGPDPLEPEAPARQWMLVGQGGQYAQCEFPLQAPIVIGTDPRHAAVVIDARRHPHIEPAHCQLRPPQGAEPATLFWPDGDNRFERRDTGFNGRDLDLGGGLRFGIQAAADSTPGTR